MVFWPQNDGVSLDPNRPEALGVCDYCGKSLHLRDLKYQFEWSGPGLINLHFRVGPECYDKFQEQLRSIVLPPDPIPVSDPRFENYDLDEGLQGFTQNTLNPLSPYRTPGEVVADARANGWAGPLPTPIVPTILYLPIPFVPVLALPARASRQFLMIYDPEDYEAGVSLSSITGFGNPNMTVIGSGTALVQNAQYSGTSTVWTGNVYAMGTLANQYLFLWDDGEGCTNMLDFSRACNSQYTSVLAF